MSSGCAVKVAIGKLEDAAMRVMGVFQALTEPAAIVKEIVDDALDTYATSAAIEVIVTL